METCRRRSSILPAPPITDLPASRTRSSGLGHRDDQRIQWRDRQRRHRQRELHFEPVQQLHRQCGRIERHAGIDRSRHDGKPRRRVFRRWRGMNTRRQQRIRLRHARRHHERDNQRPERREAQHVQSTVSYGPGGADRSEPSRRTRTSPSAAPTRHGTSPRTPSTALGGNSTSPRRRTRRQPSTSPAAARSPSPTPAPRRRRTTPFRCFESAATRPPRRASSTSAARDPRSFSAATPV